MAQICTVVGINIERGANRIGSETAILGLSRMVYDLESCGGHSETHVTVTDRNAAFLANGLCGRRCRRKAAYDLKHVYNSVQMSSSVMVLRVSLLKIPSAPFGSSIQDLPIWGWFLLNICSKVLILSR